MDYKRSWAFGANGAVNTLAPDLKQPTISQRSANLVRRNQITELLQQLSEQAAFINAEVIPWVLRLVMVGLGLSLMLVDFKRVIVFPKAVTIGLVAQLVGLPAAAFGLSLLFGAPPGIHDSVSHRYCAKPVLR